MQSDSASEDDALTAYRAMIRSHYAPGDDARDIAQEAYDTACAFIETELKGSPEAKAIRKSGHTMQDIQALVDQAKAHYDRAQDGKKIWKWLDKVSARIIFYGRVLDALAQHHPEYVALAWGTLKFVLMGILNHGRLVQEFSQALIQIGDALRLTKETAELYQTDDVRDAISRLYAPILVFFQQALRWYNRSRVGRALSAVFSPYELKYKDTVEQIQRCAKAVNDMAAAKSRAEIRDIHISLEMMRRETAQLKETVDGTLKVATCNKTISERIHIDVQDMLPRTRDIQLSHILDALKPQICPHDTFHTLQSIVKRSRSTKLPEAEPKNVLQTLNRWLTKEGSSLFLLRIGPRAEAKARELTTDIISLLQAKKLKVIWRLSPPHGGSVPSLTEVLKVLIHQALLVEPFLLERGDLNVAKFRSTHTDAEWASLCRTIFARLPKCYVIIETHDLFQANADNDQFLPNFLKLFQELACQAASNGHSLKFLVLCYGSGGSDVAGVGDFGALLRRPQPVPMRCKRMVAHKRGPKGWGTVQPKL